MKKSDDISKRLAQALAVLELAQSNPGAFSYLPEIIESLKVMMRNTNASVEKRQHMAAALGRLVTEDFEFSESAIGGELLNLADEFACCPVLSPAKNESGGAGGAGSGEDDLSPATNESADPRGENEPKDDG
jgi:hypothetical protein